MRNVAALVALAAVASLCAAETEYRVALIIGAADPQPVVAGLEKFGFRCQSSASASEKDLLRLIESWSTRTPTGSTALIYFAGQVKNETVNGTPAACLIAANNRPLTLASVFGSLTTRGGSRTHLFVAGNTPAPDLALTLPHHFLFAQTDLAATTAKLTPSDDLAAALRAGGTHYRSTLPDSFTLTCTGSIAISPPEKFVPGSKADDEWVNSRGMVFCWCPPGKFTAGSPPNTPGRFPDEDQREVVIADGFWIGKYELTRSQNLQGQSAKAVGTHKNHPVEMLHWDNASRMINRTLTEEQRQAGHLPETWEYHLPTEEQWEYAARAGTTTRFYFGDDLNLLPQHANFADKSYYDSGDIYSTPAHRTLTDGHVRLAPVGSFLPNPWGLHDVYGNVAEWCRDHGARGGSWVSLAENCRSAYRDRYTSRNEQTYLGYRIVIQKKAAEPTKK